jgi:hypothetical protein
MSRTLRSRRPVTRRPRLNVQKFDDRLLPSAVALSSDGTLSIVAEQHHPNSTFVDASGDQIVVHDYGEGGVTTWARSAVKRINFNGGPLADEFVNSTNIPATFRGGAGNDTLTGGSGAVIEGWAGDSARRLRGHEVPRTSSVSTATLTAIAGHRVAVGVPGIDGGDGRVVVLDAHSGAPIGEPLLFRADPTAVAMSADGSRLAVMAGRLRVIDVASREEV